MLKILPITAALFLCAFASMAHMPEMNFVVESAVVKPRPQFVIERRYIGTVKAEKFSLLNPKTSGTVASIDVKAGQQVKKGQLSLTLTSTVETKSVELALESLKRAQEKLKRSRKLFKNDVISKSQLEDAEEAERIAKSNLEAQKKQKESVEIRAPFDGVVGVPRVVLGETVQPQVPVISIMDGPFSVFINIPSSRLAEVKSGQKVVVKSVAATIDAVERSIDPINRTGFAKVILPNCETCIVGDSVNATISVYEKNNVILIDKDSFYYKNQKPYVVVIAKNEGEKRHAQVREIVIGEEQDGLVEVVSGLKDGEEIISVNPKRVTNKASVTVIK